MLVHRSNCETSTVKDGEDLGFWIMSTVDEVGRDDVLNSTTRRECLSYLGGLKRGRRKGENVGKLTSHSCSKVGRAVRQAKCFLVSLRVYRRGMQRLV